jgi:hypothetical protein
MDAFEQLRDAVASYDDWPGPDNRFQLIDAARRFVRAVDHRAEMIEQMRQHVTPSEQALSELLNLPEPK